MENIHATISGTKWRSADGYSVLKARSEDVLLGDFIIVGNFQELPDGISVQVEGDWKRHPKYGMQFAAKSLVEEQPATEEAIITYLSSNLIEGIGPVHAGHIVDAFGTDTFDVIENEPEKLKDIKGIGKKRAERIRESWERHREIRNIMMFLQKYKITPGLSVKILDRYGNDSVRTLEENPYRLADDLKGVGFKKADDVAEKMGIGIDDVCRLRSGILYVLDTMKEEGHVFGLRTQILKKAKELLVREAEGITEEPDPAKTEEALDWLLREHRLVEEDGAIYLPHLYRYEVNVAKCMLNLSKHSVSIIEPDFTRLAMLTGITYEEEQKEAIRMACGSSVCIITGGPGVGKTTVLKGILETLKDGRKLLLAAPTGRAAKRMTETTGMEAKTLHRLLEYIPNDGFQRDEFNRLEGDALIVDEASMIDMYLASGLVEAIPPGMRLIIVGDVDQLPSVGPGNVLRDLIESGKFPVARLTKIFRQDEGSRIIENAYRINHGKFPNISRAGNDDFFFMSTHKYKLTKLVEEDGVFVEKEDHEKIAEYITKLVTDRLPKFLGAPPEDIQVLTPMKTNGAGTENLNRLLQQALNPSGKEVRQKNAGRVFREGDKVMQRRNDYEKDVFNGDIGVIVSINLREDKIVVDFDGRPVRYTTGELSQLVHAYAITIHKSQGSEYDYVVIPLLWGHFKLLQRNLLYTAVTRAKKMVVLISNKGVINFTVGNDQVEERNTRLKQRLMDPNFPIISNLSQKNFLEKLPKNPNY